MNHVSHSIPHEKVWRHKPSTDIPIGDIVWFFASCWNGYDQECLTGIVTACRVLPAVGHKDGEDSIIFVIRIGVEEWLVDSSRVFEYWEDCDREARIYAKWCRELRRIV